MKKGGMWGAIWDNNLLVLMMTFDSSLFSLNIELYVAPHHHWWCVPVIHVPIDRSRWTIFQSLLTNFNDHHHYHHHHPHKKKTTSYVVDCPSFTLLFNFNVSSFLHSINIIKILFHLLLSIFFFFFLGELKLVLILKKLKICY